MARPKLEIDQVKGFLAYAILKPMEKWRDIKGFKNYQISNKGRVRRKLLHGKYRILKTYARPDRYVAAAIFRNKKHFHVYVHRLVAIEFLRSPRTGEEVNHRDGNKANNCIQNLEWVTVSENAVHAFKLKLRKSGTQSINSKLTLKQVRSIYRKRYKISSITLSKQMKVSKPVILSIWKKEKYKEELKFI